MWNNINKWYVHLLGIHINHTPSKTYYQEVFHADNKGGFGKEYGNYHQYNFVIILIWWYYPCLFIFNAWFFYFLCFSLYSTHIFDSIFISLSLDHILWLMHATSRFRSKTVSSIFPVISNTGNLKEYWFIFIVTLHS